MTSDVTLIAKRWLDAEPDDDIRAELQALVDGDAAELADRFGGRLQFGTAGLRAAVGAGPLRMNRLVAAKRPLGWRRTCSRRIRQRRRVASSSGTTLGARATCSPATRRA